MNAHVPASFVASSEFSAAVRALERSFAGVRPKEGKYATVSIRDVKEGKESGENA